MNTYQLEAIKKWFHDYVQKISPDNEKLFHLIRLKLDHSIYVAENARVIAEGMKWPELDAAAAEALGLLHDTGRFSQARCIPATIFCRSKLSRRPSFLTTSGSISSTRS